MVVDEKFMMVYRLKGYSVWDLRSLQGSRAIFAHKSTRSKFAKSEFTQ